MPFGSFANASSGRREDGERPVAAERGGQAGGLHGGGERLERAGLDGGLDDVVGAGHDHAIDHVDDAVRALDVGLQHVGTIDADALAEADVDLLAVERGGAVLRATTSEAMTRPGTTW